MGGEGGGVLRLNKGIHFRRPIDFDMSNKGKGIG